MKQKNPKFEFLNTNPNPTLGDLLALLEEGVNNTPKSSENLSVLVNDLKLEVSRLSTPNGIIDLIEQLHRQIEEKDFFGASDKIKNGLKRIKLLKKHNHLEQKIDILYNNVEKAKDFQYEVTPHEKALFLLSELVHLNKSIYTPLSEMKDEFSPEIFTLYIVFQTIGYVNGNGWAFGIFGNMPQLVPYISDELEELGYKKIPEAIRSTINIFPKSTSFLFDNQEYIDVLNFIENPKRKVENTNLEKYTKEEREQFFINYHNSLKKIEVVGDEIWNGNNEWEGVIKYYNAHLEKKVWKTTQTRCISNSGLSDKI